MIIDLRSDTVTQPTPAMREAMLTAPLGDDVFGEDPTINQLESKCAELLGMEAAIFCPSGTMSNQIGINVITCPYEEIICYQRAHIYKYEGGGLAGNSQLSTCVVAGNRGRLSPADIEPNIHSSDVHYARTAAVALENTVMSEAGSFYSLSQIKEVSEFSKSKELHVHLDGARLFNALAETGDSPNTLGKYFDTISICLSKGLGAPVGSMLVSKKKWASKIRRMRKVFGGGMRQAGLLAAAGIYALDHHRDRLKDDHQRAKELGKILINQAYVKSIMPIDTNIVIFELIAALSTEQFLKKIGENNIKARAFSSTQIRFVTHLDFDDRQLEETIRVLKKITY